jgi:hypothetical protein
MANNNNNNDYDYDYDDDDDKECPIASAVASVGLSGAGSKTPGKNTIGCQRNQCLWTQPNSPSLFHHEFPP